MIYGIGVDSASVQRMAEKLTKEHFVQRVFGEQERMLFAAKKNSAAQSAAANFAAKEAFLKAAGTGLGGFSLMEIQAVRKESGAPVYLLSGKAKAFFEEKGLKAHLSMTHEEGIATAFCIFEQLGTTDGSKGKSDTE